LQKKKKKTEEEEEEEEKEEEGGGGEKLEKQKWREGSFKEEGKSQYVGSRR
jgi:hypothetical protein